MSVRAALQIDCHEGEASRRRRRYTVDAAKSKYIHILKIYRRYVAIFESRKSYK